MSARALTVRNMEKVVKKRDKEATDPPDLGPDEMRLYSYYKPGLIAGNYQITTTQTISSATALWGQQDLTIKNTLLQDTSGTDAPQEFEVVVPRFSLDSNLINSYYPPDGHQDEGRVLPHIVLNDPHYPWEVPAGSSDRMSQQIDGPHNVTDKDGKPLLDKNGQNIVAYRSFVPWVALLVFDPEELHLNGTDNFKITGILTDPTPQDLLNQNAKGTFQMTVQQYLSLQTDKRMKYEADESLFDELKAMTSNVDIIFPTRKIFKQAFAYPQVKLPPNTKGHAISDLSSLEAQKYMAHVRHINTIGFPDAGIKEEGLFSIVVSSRLGAYDITQPHTQVCHLVSIEHTDSTLQSMTNGLTDDDDKQRVGMVSLFSWIYTALPPNPVNFVDTVRNLVNNQQMLSVEKKVLESIGSTKEASKIVSSRLKQGYTLSRWRTQSGEQTAAFSRGPLIPGRMNKISDDVPDCSNTSQHYQILDPQTGLMDLSYSSAWQLGKTMAISDTTFSSALMRFRSLVHNNAVQETQMTVNKVIPAIEAIRAIQPVLDNMRTMSANPNTDPSRISSGTDRALPPIMQDPAVTGLLQAHMKDNVKANASAGSAKDGTEVYNEFNKKKGNNSDWAIIHAWICEKLCLGGIPPQYLLPEPAVLPPESLRFFHIDDFWLDCFVDGALSVANHLETDDDATRREMKAMFNQYLREDVPRAGYRPQIPCYGFIIRSQLIKAMPDLRITVTWLPVIDMGHSDDRTPVCRWTKWDDETLMALLDRMPEELESIVLAQPPHQQRFSLGSYVRKGVTGGKPDHLEFDLRTLYTSENPQGDKKDYPFGDGRAGEWKEKLIPPQLNIEPSQWLDFDTRVMKVTKMAKEINESLQFKPRTPKSTDSDDWQYRDAVPNSCELGLELNDPSYYFLIKPITNVNKPVKPTMASQPLRQLRIHDPNIPLPSDAKTAFDKLINNRPAPPTSNPSTSNNREPASQPPTIVPQPPNQNTSIEALPPSRTFEFFNTSTRKPGLSTPNLSALFTFITISADYKTPPPLPRNTTRFSSSDYVPDRNIYFYDLIFSIRKPLISPHSSTPVLAQDLLRIDIDFPTAPSQLDLSKRPAKEPLLEADYYGPGIRMLSNQRFIPFLFHSAGATPQENGDMHIELRPRATNDDYALTTGDNRTVDLSFKLAEAPISKVIVPSIINIDGRAVNSIGRVEAKITEWYKTAAYPGGEPVRHKDPYVLLKKQVREDEGWPEFG